MGFLNYWTPYLFTVTILCYEYGHKDHGHHKVISRSRSFQNQIGSVPISISKRTLGLRPNAFLFDQCTCMASCGTFLATLCKPSVQTLPWVNIVMEINETVVFLLNPDIS